MNYVIYYILLGLLMYVVYNIGVFRGRIRGRISMISLDTMRAMMHILSLKKEYKPCIRD